MIFKSEINLLYETAASLKCILLTILFCCVLYPGIVWFTGRTLVPEKAEGSLIKNSAGTVIGSHLIAQGFSQDRYFWPRPSAIAYNASASGGSNLSPVSVTLHDQIQTRIVELKPTAGNPVPVELVTSSGSGLDPHITVQAALFQAERVAQARGISLKFLTPLINKQVKKMSIIPGSPALINVLDLNLALDQAFSGNRR